MTRTFAKRTVALSAAFGVAIAAGTFGIEATAPSAVAQTTPAPTQQIPADAKGKLTITKFVNNTEGDQANGQEMPTAGMGDPLANVTYKIEKLQADVTTDAGLAEAAKLTVTSPKDGSFAQQEKVTDSSGIAIFENLPVGVYLVTETAAPDGVVQAAPFLVFLPMTNPDGTGWNYDVHAYPKNTKTAVEKSVDDADKNVGDTITYTIKSDVPALAANNTEIAKYEVHDDLDESMLTTSAGQVKVTVAGVEYTQGTDYNVTVDAATQKVEVVFTKAGLTKLTAAKRADAAVRVETAITATVGKIGDTNGIVTNEAKTIANNGGGGGDTTTPSNPVETQWGKVIINKKDEEGTPLADAIFSVYRCTADGQLIGEAITLKDQDSSEKYQGSQFTTNADGTVTIDGLHSTELEDNLYLDEPKFYCLVEEQAPAGYAKLREPIPFELKQTQIRGAAGTDIPAIEYTAEVVNYKDNKLPGTGGMGVTLIIIAGVAVVGAGAYAAKRSGQKA